MKWNIFQVTDYSEPVDVRKNRALTLENMKLQREVERLRGFQGDNEFLKKEVKNLKTKLEEEQKCRSKNPELRKSPETRKIP